MMVQSALPLTFSDQYIEQIGARPRSMCQKIGPWCFTTVDTRACHFVVVRTCQPCLTCNPRGGLAVFPPTPPLTDLASTTPRSQSSSTKQENLCGEEDVSGTKGRPTKDANLFGAKICFCASSGGHYNQLSQLSGIARRHPSFAFTERTDFPPALFCERNYYLPVCNRRDWLYPLKLLAIAITAFRTLRKEQPETIISTGAMATIPILVVGKLLGMKIIYVEALARVKSPSMTGRLVYKFADMFVVRWSEMLKVYPRAVLDGDP